MAKPLAFLVPLVILPLAACEDNVGVNTVTYRSADGVTESQGQGCILLGDGLGAGGGGGGGPEYAEEFVSADGMLSWSWWITPEAYVDDPDYFPTPSDGEWVASFEEDMDFFKAGGTADRSFETYTGVGYKIYIWGTEDCEGELEPPPGVDG